MFPLYLILLMPLLGAIINGATALHVSYHQKKPCEKWVSFVGVLFPLLSFVFALHSAWPYLFDELSAPRTETLFNWMTVSSFNLDFSLTLDKLSSLMVLIITGVGTLIHLYSTGYMKGDSAFARYFAYLNLFLFSMLVLILGDNLLVLFIGWEGVGLCSYLLIGFWFDDAAKASAGKKAFVVNRIGDFGFLLACFMIASIFLPHSDIAAAGIFKFSTLAQYKDLLAPTATVIALLFFLGASGKSAQIPLYIWLPDAMAGPTPVSALIHAATMVTAGVYLVARLSFLFDLAPYAREVVATVGAMTALFAATIGLVQRDIKKVLAYSTVSQLGYMFLAVGIGANVAGIFHVMTHAFFKACLFLGSGSVIHAMHGEQDIFKMGGLKKWMPITYWTFLISTIAIAGIPPFAGFFSKDEILWQAFSRGYPQLWAIGFVAAGITAFYMFRLVTLTFFGKCRADHHTQEHLHESPLVMTLPLVILAFLAIVGGFVGIPHAFGGHNLIHEWLSLDSVVNKGGVPEHYLHTVMDEFELPLAALSAGWAVLWSIIALWLYSNKMSTLESIAKRCKSGYQLLYQKYYVDEVYEFLIIKPIHFISKNFLWRGVDSGIIDGVLVNGSAKTTSVLGELVGMLQTGIINTYAFWFSVGLLGVLVWVFRGVL